MYRQIPRKHSQRLLFGCFLGWVLYVGLQKIEPNIYKKQLNSGGWTYYIKAKISGRTVTRSCKTQSIRAAREQLRRLQEDASRGKAPHARSSRDVESFYLEVKKLWEAGAVREVTAHDYEKRYVRYVRPRWGSTPIQTIRTRAVQQWIDDLRESKSAATCARILTVLSLICRQAQKKDYLPDGNPCVGVEIRADAKREIVPLTG